MPKVPREEVKPFVNVYAKEAKTPEERAYWTEASHFAERLYQLVRMAHSYHNGEKFEGITGQPVANEILRCAVKFNDAENAALAVRWCRERAARAAREKLYAKAEKRKAQ